MTTKEQQTVSELTRFLTNLSEDNKVFRNKVMDLIEGMTNKIEEKHLLLSLEKQVFASIDVAIAKGLSEALSNSYNSPLIKYANNVVAKYQKNIEAIFDEVVKEGIGSDEFKVHVREVLLNKISKTIISGIDGSVDKTINLMKQNEIFRGRLVLAVNRLVEEFLSTSK